MTVRDCGHGVSAMSGVVGAGGENSGHRRGSYPGGPAAGPPVPLAAPRLLRPPPQMRLQSPSPPPLPRTPPLSLPASPKLYNACAGLGEPGGENAGDISSPLLFSPSPSIPVPPPLFLLLRPNLEGGIYCCRN